jgi:hypothetical protein
MDQELPTPTDRELIELSAKAIGIAGAWDAGVNGFVRSDGCDVLPKLWAPLHDGDDSLLLLMEMGFSIVTWDSMREVRVISPRTSLVYMLPFGDDKIATVKRVVVRAAASDYEFINNKTKH